MAVTLKGYPYTVTLPINHGMGKALLWFEDNGIDFRWGTDSINDTVTYYFKNDNDTALFALRWS